MKLHIQDRIKSIFNDAGYYLKFECFPYYGSGNKALPENHKGSRVTINAYKKFKDSSGLSVRYKTNILRQGTRFE